MIPLKPADYERIAEHFNVSDRETKKEQGGTGANQFTAEQSSQNGNSAKTAEIIADQFGVSDRTNAPFSRPISGVVDTQDPGKPHGLKSTIWRRVKELFALLDNDAVLILFDPHRDFLAGLEREPIIAGHVRRDRDIPGPCPIGELNDFALSFFRHSKYISQ